MHEMEMLLSQKLDYFSHLIRCGQNLFYYEYDTDLGLIKTSCDDVPTYSLFFTFGNCQDYLREYVAKNNPQPLVLTNEIGLSWICGFEYASGSICRIHVIGPVFNSDVSGRQLEQEILRKGFSEAARQSFINQIDKIPILPLSTWFQFGQMLHYTITGENAEISDYNCQTSNEIFDIPDESLAYGQPLTTTWLAEQAAMQMIEEGQLDYKEALGRLTKSVEFIAPPNEKNQMRKLKNANISLVTLATRAAIRGGLDAELAYFVGNFYIQKAEDAGTLSELMQLNSKMYDDFVNRVHKIKTQSDVSPAIQACCGYIEAHLPEKLTLKVIASKVNYSEYYMAQKFKKEVGLSVTDYIKHQRVDRAKTLLRSTNRSVAEIAEELGYCNASYFNEAFKSVESMTPSEFRATWSK
jgi:AraC-like DNA-binding protein